MIVICPKCNTEFDNQGKWSVKKFCSRKCSNSRVFSEESKQKKSAALKGKPTGRKGQKLTPERKEQWLRKIKAKRDAVPFETLGWDTKRLRVIKEQYKKCNRCGIDNWLGEKLTLEVDHTDGNSQNNNRGNLEGLCPNCHSLTKTWRGKNKNNAPKITDSELLDSLNTTSNIHQALINVGMSPRGANYIRAKELLNVGSKL